MTLREDKKPTFDEIECEHLIDLTVKQGNLPVYHKSCMVATDMAGYHIPAHAASCKHCLLSKNPKADNEVTNALINIRNHEVRKYSERIVDESVKRAGPRPALTPSQRLGEGPGTELSNLIPKQLEHVGCGCKDYARKMNRWGVEGCTKRFDQIVEHLVKKSNTAPLLGWVPSTATRMVAKNLVRRAIDKANKNRKASKLTWFVGVATAPRPECTLTKCTDSMRVAGFDPVIFAEPGSTRIESCNMITNKEKKGVWYNWISLCEYALNNTSADVIMTVQDDSLFHPDSKTFAEKILWPAEDCGFVSLYTPKHYSIKPHFKTEQRDIGVNRVYTRSMWGACALIWPRVVLEAVMDHEITKSWLGAPTKSRSQSVIAKRKADRTLVQNSDTAIGKIMNRMRRSMWFVDPSPVEHVAQHSVVGHGGNGGRRNCSRCASWDTSLEDQVPINFDPVDIKI